MLPDPDAAVITLADAMLATPVPPRPERSAFLGSLALLGAALDGLDAAPGTLDRLRVGLAASCRVNAPTPGSLDPFEAALTRLVGVGVPFDRLPTAHPDADVPSLALLESHRLDADLVPELDAAWFLRRFRRWSGRRFVSPLFGVWTIARWSRRFERRPAESAADEHHERLRTTLLRMIEAHRRPEGGVGRFDPLIHESLAVLALDDLGMLGATVARDAATRIRSVLRDDPTPETPFHSSRPNPEDAGSSDPPPARERPLVLHVDPERRVGTALASLALRTSRSVGDRAATRRDPYRVECRTGADAAEQVRLNLRGVATPGGPATTDPGDPFVTPRPRVGLDLAIRDTLARLGPAIVSPRAATRVLDAVAGIREAHVKGATVGLEFRLHRGDDTVDVAWCLRRRDRNLTALLDDPDPNSRFRHLARLWNLPPGGEPPPIAFLESIWFEHDLHHDDASVPPAFFFGPSATQLAHTPRYEVGAVAVNLHRVVAALDLDAAIADPLHRIADRVAALPTTRTLFQTGVMFSRSAAPIRLCFRPIPDRDGVEELLGDLGAGGERARTRPVLDAITAAEGRAAICVDVTLDGVHPRIGFETYPPVHIASTDFHGSVLDRLSRDGTADAMIDPARVESLRRIEGWTELSDAGGCHRTINHVKYVTRPHRPVEAKAYLALSRRPTPDFTPPRGHDERVAPGPRFRDADRS